MNFSKFLEKKYKLIESCIKVISYNKGLKEEEVEEFKSEVMLKLCENDYKILREYKGKSSFKTYIIVVISRIYIDLLRKKIGRWRASKVAEVYGETGRLIEELIYKKGYSISEACKVLSYNYGIKISEEEIEEITKNIYPKENINKVDFKEIKDSIKSADLYPDKEMEVEEREAKRYAIERIIKEEIEKLSDIDKLIIKLKFESNISTNRISKALGISNFLLKKKIKEIMELLKESVIKRGYDEETIKDLLNLEV